MVEFLKETKRRSRRWSDGVLFLITRDPVPVLLDSCDNLVLVASRKEKKN